MYIIFQEGGPRSTKNYQMGKLAGSGSFQPATFTSKLEDLMLLAIGGQWFALDGNPFEDLSPASKSFGGIESSCTSLLVPLQYEVASGI